jgi:hypothetical protein
MHRIWGNLQGSRARALNVVRSGADVNAHAAGQGLLYVETERGPHIPVLSIKLFFFLVFFLIFSPKKIVFWSRVEC